MRHCLCNLVAVVSLVLCINFGGGVCGAGETKLNRHTFTLPDGFEIEQVAGPPLVNRPIEAAFDEQGRLYVTDSSGSNEPVKVQLEKRPHRIVRLEDSDGDGRYDKSTVFADRMMFPEGALWYAGSLYVSAAPQIWKLTDTDGDGVADQREVWFDGKTLTGCANDLHGPYLGLDGWIYWCKGAFAEQTYERPGKPPFLTRAAHIFRRRPEGGVIEPVMTGGMDNPVEVVFTPGGERIFTTTFLQHPGGGLRDGLIHAIYGGVYGKEHGVLDGHPRTGPLMPVLVHLGAAAPCGLARLESDQLGADYRDNLLACLFNMQKVTRHVLKPDGATFAPQNSDFLVSDNVDFHPTDVLEDADGSVLVVDTGGWYKLCCPTSQLWKPDVLGAIYRVRRTGSHRVADARGNKIDWVVQSDDQLCGLLGDGRFAVRDRAREALGRRGAQAVGSLQRVLESSDKPEQRRQAVWALTRIDDSQARAAVRRALGDGDEVVRQAGLHSISVRQDRDAESALIAMLHDESAHNRRAAAEALSRVGTPRAVPALLAASGDENDRVLEHSLTYALLEIADAAQTRQGLADQNPRTRRAALIALDQMAGGTLQASDVRPLLDSDEPILRDTAWWIADHHADWAADLAGYFRGAIAHGVEAGDEAAVFSTRLARFAQDAAVQQAMADGLANASLDRSTRVAILNAMASSGLKGVPDVWSAPLADQLGTSDAAVLEPTVAAVKALAGSELGEAFVTRLGKIARDDRLPAATRLEALAALPAAARKLDADLLRFVCDHLAVDEPVPVRSLAVDVLLNSPLDTDQLLVVADAMEHAGPMELKQLMELFGKSHDPRVGAELVASLERCPSAGSLHPDDLAKQFTSYGDTVRRSAEPLLARIEQENRAKTEKLETVLKLAEHGDIRRGQLIFRGTKAACTSCHSLGYLGGHIGPDLTRIGRIRTERDLIESILFPSASFVRSFEPTMIVTSEGRVFNGVVRDENAQQITLQLDAEKIVQIPQRDVEERTPGTVSIMPEGLDKQFTPQELADLVTFLKAAQ